MDARRPSRTVADPKVRQVGFVTPNDPPERSQSVPAIGSSPPVSDHSPAGTLSPVMIPPPRHASDNLSSSLGLLAGHPIPVPAVRRPISDGTPLGSYNPPDPVLGTSPMLSSPSSRNGVDGEFSEDLVSPGWARGNAARVVASSFPSAGVDTAALTRDDSSLQPVSSNLTTVSLVKLPHGASEKGKGVVADGHSERATVSKPQKEKLSKSERRALQEAQRAAKVAAKESAKGMKGAGTSETKQNKTGKPPVEKKEGGTSLPSVPASEKKAADRSSEKDRKKDIPPPRMQFDDTQRVEKSKKRAVVHQTEARNRVELFRHLPQYVHGTQFPELESKFFQLDQMHPAVYKVGLLYLAGDISGGNARCIAMLQAFREAIKDYSTPSDKTLIRELTARINSYVSFLIECRPLSISMGNAIKFLKNRIAELPLSLTETEAKATLQSDINRFINEKIVLAAKVIVRHAVSKIRDGDVLLTYASSSLVEMILFYAHELGTKFRVVVVDSRPKLEGQSLLRRLVARGISCTYTHLNAISYVMHEVTRVFLGASSVLANGTVYSRVGTACVAMVAHEFRVPVLICCEAYKFHERVQLDSICSNELGDPDALSKVHGRGELKHLEHWADVNNLQLLNLVYDITPSEYVSMIVTDYGMVPPTSVPVIVREYRQENLWI